MIYIMTNQLEKKFQRRWKYEQRKHFINKTDEMLEKFIEECEQEAAKLEITVDYYLAEFI